MHTRELIRQRWHVKTDHNNRSKWLHFHKYLTRNFPFDFEPNGILFGSKSKGKLSPLSYHMWKEIEYEFSQCTVRETKKVLNMSYHRLCTKFKVNYRLTCNYLRNILHRKIGFRFLLNLTEFDCIYNFSIKVATYKSYILDIYIYKLSHFTRPIA